MKKKIIFKQKINRESIFNYCVILIFSTLFLVMSIILFINNPNDRLANLISLIILFSSIFCPIYGMTCLEWFEVYEDKIVVKCPLKTKNTVYFSNVKQIRIKKIFYALGMYKYFYIFDDGRKFQDSHHPWNSKKCNLKIYVTKQLEEFIKTKKDIEIIEEDDD